MVKTIGALLILIGCISLGSVPIYQMNLRIKQLKDYIELLHKLQSELRTDPASLLQLFSRIKITKTSSAYELCQITETALSSHDSISFRAFWNEHISSRLPLFTDEELCAIKDVGESLGKYILEEELLFVENAISVLQEGRNATKEKKQELTKLYIGFAAASGIMLILVLI